MEERTRAYLRGRFRDHYRRADVTAPPGADVREWGYIPWTEGPDTTMVRHRSLLDLGDLEEFLVRERPRHVYFSAGYYDDPSERTMDGKGWNGSDVVFDIDADHLPNITPGEDSYAEMLAAGKEHVIRLLDFLERDFGFEDLTVVFSGGRGYHVHVRDEDVKRLEREQRREIVDYVRGNGLDLDALVEEETVEGVGVKNPTEKQTLPTDGGWGRRVVEHLDAYVDELLELDEEDALFRLQTFDGIGEGRAEAILTVAEDRRAEIRRGNIDLHPAFKTLVKKLVGETVAEQSSAIDEPVTTDTHRLIRLPGTLHGGSGLEVVRIDRDDIDDFDPLVDAVPETFVGHEITVDAEREYTLELLDETFSVSPGEVTLPEYAGVFLMSRGWAEKGRE